MDHDGIEHHAEVRRTQGPLLWVVVVVAVALVVALLAWPDGDGPASRSTAPTTTPTSSESTLPRRLPVLHLVADTVAGPRPATTADAPDPSSDGGPAFEALQATPVITDGRVIVLVDGGEVLAGRAGDPFAAIGLDAPSSALIASNEPGHVWVVTPEDELALVDLDGVDPPVRIPLEGDRVLGPGSFGVVTVSPSGAVSWRRPSFEPAPIPLSDGRVAVDAGGDVVLVERSLGDQVGRGFELLSVFDGTVIADFVEPPSDGAAVVSPDGSVVALPDVGRVGGAPDLRGWTVRDARTREELGSLRSAPGAPVWIGGDRFAILADGAAAVSDGTVLAPPWRMRALAEHSP